LYDRFSQHFGDDNIFMDIDTIEPGLDFVEVIEEAVGSCDVLIALIGRQWLTITDATGQRRLDNPEDFVRLEIETALDRNIRVIPVLVQGAAMPRSSELPDDLRKLARRNALSIGDRFHPDVDHLIKVVENVLITPVSAPPKPITEKRAERPPAPSQPKPKEEAIPPKPKTEIKEPAPTPAPAAQPRLTNWLLFGGVGGGGLLLVIILGSIIFYVFGGTDLFLPQTITASDGSPMVLIPVGPFTMGSDSGEKDEQPAHEVTLDAYYIDQYEVTNARYADCVAAGECKLPGFIELYEDPGKKNHPVVGVDWEQANTYCEWRGDKLPTEAEWEKAAQGPDGRIYPWGDAAPNEALLNFSRNVGDTTPVGSYPDGVSPYGAYDMAGNVVEWVADWYDEDYYATATSYNPQGPADGEVKVLRGGAWDVDEFIVRASHRFYAVPSGQTDGIGFRCAAAPPE
jgi:formylglycine-generating enzyme required for sulfatase activity